MNEPRTLARHLAALNARWRAHAPLPNGRPLTYRYYRYLLHCILAEHIEAHHADE